MHRVFRSLMGFAALAVWSIAVWTGTAPRAFAQAAAAPAQAKSAQPEKKLKDTQEYDLYNNVLKDIQSQNFTKAITDLDTWKAKYPDSDYKDDRQYYYIQAYNGAKQPAKVLEAAQPLLDKDLTKVFKDPRLILGALYQTAIAITTIRDPTPDQAAIAEKAAKQLLAYAPTYFVPANKPAGTDDAAWAKARADLETGPKAALMYIEVAPATKAMAAKDCPTADKLFTKALTDYPDNAYIAYNLGAAENCEARAQPDKAAEIAPKAIYEFVRAAVTDPTLGKTTDPKQVTDFASKIYTSFHGSDEGLDKVKELAKTSALPPAGFTIESSAAVAIRKQNEFAQSNPMLALWMGIKGQLADANGQQYFDSQLKDSQVPKLKGVVVEGKPACRSKEVLVAVPLPDNTSGANTPEITLKLVDEDRKPIALPSKVVPGAEIQFEGVPSGFTKDPFMLTMDTEKGKIEGLKTEPCAPVAPPRKKK